MIVDSMTHMEAYREIYADIDNLERWFRHQYAECRRKALKLQRFPVMWWLEYKSPRHIHYLIGVTVTGRRFEKNHGIVVLVLRRESRGHTVYLSKIQRETTGIQRTIFLQHVFDQYARRMNIDKSSIELIKHVFSQQGGGHTMFDNRLMGRSVRYNEDRKNACMVIKDGILFGDIAEESFIVHTFISHDLATGYQKKRFSEAQEKLLDWEEEIEHISGGESLLKEAIAMKNNYW